MIILILLLIYSIIVDTLNFINYKNMKIFRMFKQYFLKKYIFFITWKNSTLFLLSLQFYYKKKYITIITILNLILITLGFNLFYANIYDIIFNGSINLNLLDPIYEPLEPSFNSHDTELTPAENAKNRIQRDPLIYNFFIIATCICIAFVIYK